LREEIVPGHFVIPDQIIDRTKGIREETFFRGEGLVVHSMFGNPFSDKLNAFVAPRVEEILKTAEGSPKLHTGKTVVCMEGELAAVIRALSIPQEYTLIGRTRFLHKGRISDVQAMGRRHHQHVCYPRGKTRPRGRARVSSLYSSSPVSSR
jgi:hypothetical protein